MQTGQLNHTNIVMIYATRQHLVIFLLGITAREEEERDNTTIDIIVQYYFAY